MAKKPSQTIIDKLLDDLSIALVSTRKRQEKLTTSIKVLSNLKNNPVDEFSDPLTKEYMENCMDKCKRTLTDSS